jgi:LPXTG-site transpeptidase (sortase) family protein
MSSFSDTIVREEHSFATGRFVRTFFFSFLLSLCVLYVSGFAPAGLSQSPARFFDTVASYFRSDESALVATLPEPSALEKPGEVSPDVGNVPSVVSPSQGVSLSRMLRIPAASIEVPVVSPLSTDTAILDESLKSGVVRYPGSGELGERANVLFFGHSSHLPVVHNPAFRALNGLESVRLGDDIFVSNGEREYRYRVFAVRLTTADEELISFSTTERKLTISTCNTFGSKSERFVVEAVFVGSEPLRQ